MKDCEMKTLPISHESFENDQYIYFIYSKFYEETAKKWSLIRKFLLENTNGNDNLLPYLQACKLFS